MSLEGDEQIPGWGDASLIDTAARFSGDGADVGLPDSVRFRTNVARLIRRRMAVVAHQSGAPAVFVLLPAGPADPAGEPLEAMPMLNNGITEVEGRIWFVGPAASRGLGCVVEEWNDQQVFDLAGTLRADSVPAILYENRTDPHEARYYPNGLGDPDNYELLRLSSADVTLQEILDTVNHQYERSLKTPSAQHREGQLWYKPRKHYPVKQAEAKIAYALREGLTGKFPTCTVREEQPQPTGRLDLEIEEPHPEDRSQVVRHAVLELKVLRSYWNSGEPVPENTNAAAVEDGVRQAASYRIDRQSRSSALCCFDMRVDVVGDTCFEDVRGLARRHRVTLRVWHIFNSDKAYREHVTR